MNHITLIFLITLSVSVLSVVPVINGIFNHQVKAELTANNVAGKYLQGLNSKLDVCKDNPSSSHSMPTILIPGNASGKSGGVTAYGNANSENGKNGPISVGGGHNENTKNGGSPISGVLGNRSGNGGVALCGSANGQ